MDIETTIIPLLQELSLLEKDSERRLHREESFNIISILRKPHDERYLHSRFIASLIDSKAPHGRQDFLQTFLEEIHSRFRFSPASLSITPNYYDGCEKNDIDIYIRDCENAIIIENKIYSKDSNHENKGQLEKLYENVLKDGYDKENIEIYYLTLDGHSPSPESVSKSGMYPDLKDKVLKLTYAETIINWLNICLKKVENNNLMKEIIMQYLKIVEKLTGSESSVDERIRLMEIIGETDSNIDGARFIIKNQVHVFWHMLFFFWKELTDKLIEQGYCINQNIENDVITNFIHERRNDGDGKFQLKCNKNSMEIIVRCLQNQVLQYSVKGNGFCDFLFKEGELRLSDFTSDPTFRLLSKAYRTAIIEEIIATLEAEFSLPNKFEHQNVVL